MLRASQNLFKCSLRIESSSVSRTMHSLIKNQAYINGKWTSGIDNKQFDVINPSTLKVVGQVADLNVEDVRLAIDAANDAFYNPEWYQATAKDRSIILKVIFI